MLKALLEKRAKLVADMAAIIKAAETANRDLTAEEQTSFDAFKAEKDKLDKRIDNAGVVDEAEAELAAARPAAARGNGPAPRAGGPEPKKEFETLAEFMYAVRFNRNDPRLHYVESVRNDGTDLAAASTMRMDNDTTGGFMIPPKLRTEMMSVPPQEALVRPRANVLPAGDPPDASVIIPALDQTVANNNMFGGVTVSWIAEGGAKPQTDAKLRNITLTPHEVAGYMEVTDKLLRNWSSADAWIRGLLRNAVLAAEDYAFLRGTGVGQPLGVINAGATKFINRAGANAVSYADVVNMAARLLMRSSVNSPIWSITQAALPQLRTMVDPEGHYIWVDNARDGNAGTLLGFPVRWNNRAPALGSKGDVVLADWSYYLIQDGSGPFVAASEHVKFLENKTVIKIFWNVDGAPWLTAPIAEENGYTVSPFVGLDVP